MADIFTAHLEWTGAARGVTDDPATFSRELESTVAGMTLPMSSAPGYRGDSDRANPEQLLVASLSACQALTYLFLAAKNGVRVAGYADDAEGRLALVDGRMRVSTITLRPRIAIESEQDADLARDLVEKAHRGCFIANSISCRVAIEPVVDVRQPSDEPGARDLQPSAKH